MSTRLTVARSGLSQAVSTVGGMFCTEIQREVMDLRERCGGLVSRLDPDDLPASQAPVLWRELDRLARQVAAAKTVVARRVDDSLVWQREGFPSAAEYLAAHGGMSVGAARTELETSRVLPELPHTRAALLEGAVSAQQGALIAEAAKINPAAERSLVDAAEHDSFKELRDRSLRAKASADPSPEATHRRIHRARRLREHVDAEGAWNLHARGTVADGQKIHAALVPIIEELFRQGRRDGTHDTGEARAFDALVQVAENHADTAAARGRRRHRALVRCDLAALQRGSVEDDEVCEIAGVGPIPVHLAVELLGDATWKLLITRGVDVLNVTTLSRRASAAMLAALAWSAPACSVEGCSRTITQIDHRIPWAETRHTTLAELDPLCPHHHHLKTREGWQLADGTGTRPFIPPPVG